MVYQTFNIEQRISHAFNGWRGSQKIIVVNIIILGIVLYKLKGTKNN
jgi:hypothetical protein